jgi:hypothetical protein
MTELKPFRTMSGQWTVSDKAKKRDKLVRDDAGNIRQFPDYLSAKEFAAIIAATEQSL